MDCTEFIGDLRELDSKLTRYCGKGITSITVDTKVFDLFVVGPWSPWRNKQDKDSWTEVKVPLYSGMCTIYRAAKDSD